MNRKQLEKTVEAVIQHCSKEVEFAETGFYNFQCSFETVLVARKKLRDAMDWSLSVVGY